MILNPWSVTALFLAAVGSVLSVMAAGLALRALLGARSRAAREAGEDRSHLLALVLGVLALVHLLAWPVFYLMLESYVPELAPFGVMCAFGVTRIQAPLVSAIEWLEPLALALLGFWWLLVQLERRAGGASVVRRRDALALVPVSVAGIASVLAIVYVFREKVGRPVTCCTQFLDTQAARVAPGVVSLLPAPLRVASASLLLYVAFTAAAVTAGLVTARLASRSGLPPTVPRSVALAGLALLNLAVTHAAWTEAVAPRVLGLPYHHCVYELVTGVPMLGLAALMALAGNACLVWPLGLLVWRREAGGAVAGLCRDVDRLGALLLASSLVVVLVHAV